MGILDFVAWLILIPAAALLASSLLLTLGMCVAKLLGGVLDWWETRND